MIFGAICAIFSAVDSFNPTNMYSLTKMQGTNMFRKLSSPKKQMPLCTLASPLGATAPAPGFRISSKALKDMIPLRIDGVWYDLSDYADAHPGGRWLLDYSRGKDVSALFRSIHLFSAGEPAAILRRLPTVPEEQASNPFT